MPERSRRPPALPGKFPTQSQKSPPAADLPLLFTAVRTAALDLAKSRRRLRQWEQRAACDGPAAWWDADTLTERERVAAVQGAVEALPAEQREAVVLRIWGGLTFAEAASTLGANINTVVSRYRAALATLQKHLPETCHEVDR